MKKEKLFAISIIVLIWLGCAALGFAVMAGSVYLLSLCFGFTFTWKLAFGLWIIYLIVLGLFNSAGKD